MLDDMPQTGAAEKTKDPSSPSSNEKRPDQTFEFTAPSTYFKGIG